MKKKNKDEGAPPLSSLRNTISKLVAIKNFPIPREISQRPFMISINYSAGDTPSLLFKHGWSHRLEHVSLSETPKKVRETKRLVEIIKFPGGQRR